MVDANRVVCELCGVSKKNLGSHVRAKHGMGMDEYKLVTAEDLDVTDETKTLEVISAPTDIGSLESAGIVVTKEELEAGILDVEKRFTEEMSVGELIKLKNISLQELGSIITQYISGSSPHPTQTATKNEQIGVEGAKKLLGENNPGVTSLYIAEALTKKFGYTVEKVTRDPKTWWLLKP